MKRRALARRLHSLDGLTVSVSGAVWVRLDITGCRTQDDYDRAFQIAWDQAPPGAAVFCLPTLTEQEFVTECERHAQGLPPMINYRMGIYLKQLTGGIE